MGLIFVKSLSNNLLSDFYLILVQVGKKYAILG